MNPLTQDATPEQRASYIRERLIESCGRQLGMPVLTPPETWHWVLSPLPKRMPDCGWVTPVRLTEHQRMMVFSPAHIAHATQRLTVDELDTYLGAVETWISAHHAFGGTYSTHVIDQQIEEAIASETPAALRILSLVELEALDHHTARPQ